MVRKEEGGKGILSNLCMGYVEYLRSQGNTEFSGDSLRETIYGSAMLYMSHIDNLRCMFCGVRYTPLPDDAWVIETVENQRHHENCLWHKIDYLNRL